jgi:CubicO group peptidase (beta-lactamase class C family)
MPTFIKVICAVLFLVLLAMAGLYATGNEHLFEAVRSTYARGKTGPDIDNYKFFTNREVPKAKRQKWKQADEMLQLSTNDSTVLAGYETVAYLVIKEGKIVCEQYWEDYSAESLSNSFSMAKTVVAMLVGCAIDDGLIGSVEEKASKYLVELQGTDREHVTIKHLLQMTSGIGFDEVYGSSGAFQFMSKVYYGDEIVEKTFEYPQVKEPGSEWEYLGGNTLLLSYIVNRVTGKTVSEYASKKLWKPMGAEQPAYWSYDETSNAERAYCCYYSNARDFARFGQLLLCHGNWKGEQLISPTFIEEMTTPVTLNDGTVAAHYGYQLWMDNINGMEVQMMRGMLGQYVLIIPEKEMLVVRLGHKRSNEKDGHTPGDIYQFLDIANSLVP